MIERLSPKQRKALRPTRAGGTAVAPTARSAKRCTKLFRDHYSKKRLETLRAGVDASPTKALRSLHREALSVIDDPSAENLRAASLHTLGAADRFAASGDPKATLTDAIVMARGVVDAVEAKIRSLDYDLAAEPNWMVKVFLKDADREPEHRIESWVPLRHAICAADDAAYRLARDRAAWNERTSFVKSRLAFAFPDEPWAEALLRSPEATTNEFGKSVGTPTQVTRFGFLLSACNDVEAARAIVDAKGGPFAVSQSALELAVALPSKDALGLFREVLPRLLKKPGYGPLHKTPPRNVLEAILLIGTDEAVRLAAKYVGHRVLGAQATEFFQRHPDRRALLSGGGDAAKELLVRLDRLAGQQAKAGPEAAPTDVPALLRDRAWRRPKRTPKSTVVPDVTIPEPYDERFELQVPLGDHPKLEGKALEEWRKEIATGRGAVDAEYVYHQRSASSYLVPPDEGLAAWVDGRGWCALGLGWFLQRHGSDALVGLLHGRRLGHLDYEDAGEWITALEAMISPKTAPVWARIRRSRKRWRPAAEAWLRQHAEIATLGLVPVAVGREGKDRKDAEDALLFLLRTGQRNTIEQVAARYSTEVQSALTQILSRDWRVVDAKPPKLPPFLRSTDLPPLRLRAGGILGADDRDAWIELLSVAPADYPAFVGEESLRDAFDSESLESFVATLFELWAAADGPGKHDWMLRAMVALPFEATTRRLAMLARGWARSKQAPARRACEALASIGSDVALLHLGHIAATTRFQTLRGEAEKHLEEVARTRGLSRDDLEDRIVPDLGLAVDGTLDVSFGDRTFRASVDPALQVYLIDGDNTRVPAFPRGRKSDGDPALRREAKARFDAFKKDVQSIADRQKRRAERAMVLGRSWSLADARRYFFDHPLARHLARGLVWQCEAAGFRVAEDGTFATVDDEELELFEDAEVRIAHPLNLAECAAWTDRFADYEVVQPFPQLGRATAAPQDDELPRRTVDRAAGTSVR
ncbi:MAG: DUF4132 domain-containing protein, partial [Myxococcota bacterium]